MNRAPTLCSLYNYSSKFARLAQIFGNHTAEARRTRSKEFLIKTYSELCELRVSAVKFLFLLRLRLRRARRSVVNLLRFAHPAFSRNIFFSSSNDDLAITRLNWAR